MSKLTRKSIALALIGAASASVAGCDQEYKKDDPRNPSSPKVHFVTPSRGSILNEVEQVNVTGTAVDPDGDLKSVTVNGINAPVDAAGNFSVKIPLKPGVTLLRAIATDDAGNVGKQTQGVMAGKMVGVDTSVSDGILTRVSEETFTAMGRGAAKFIADSDLGALVAPMNPVVNYGAPEGPDCLFAQARIGALDVTGATIALVPKQGALDVTIVLNGLNVPMTTDYAVACVNGHGNISATADKVSIAATITLGVNKGDFDIKLTNPDVTFTNLRINTGGLAGKVISMLQIDRAIGPILGFAAERFVAPALNKSLAGLNNTKQVDVLGKKLDISIKPAAIDVDVDGAMIRLDTKFRMQGDAAGKGFVYMANRDPNMSSAGFAMAIADDSLNQLFGSVWGAGALNQKIDLTTGNYGTAGNLFSHIEINASLPPTVDANGDGSLKVVIGDLMAKFTDKESATVTAAAINGEIKLKVETTATGELRLAVDTPDIVVDVLDSVEGVEGTNALSNDQFEALLSFGLSRGTAIAAGSLGTIALPSFGGIALKDVKVASTGGFAMVSGKLQ
jgi:hypothetical protein